jgi:hypothetical protein
MARHDHMTPERPFVVIEVGQRGTLPCVQEPGQDGTAMSIEVGRCAVPCD